MYTCILKYVCTERETERERRSKRERARARIQTHALSHTYTHTHTHTHTHAHTNTPPPTHTHAFKRTHTHTHTHTHIHTSETAAAVESRELTHHILLLQSQVAESNLSLDDAGSVTLPLPAYSPLCSILTSLLHTLVAQKQVLLRTRLEKGHWGARKC